MLPSLVRPPLAIVLAGMFALAKVVDGLHVARGGYPVGALK